MGMSAAHCQGNVREFQGVWRVVTLKLGPISNLVCVEVNEYYTMVCHVTRSKVNVTRPLKLLYILLFSKSISSTVYNGSWQVTG